MKEHKLSFCDDCGIYMYKCKTCNNNSCNGTYGIVNNKFCEDCPEAYKLMYDDNNRFRSLIERIVHIKRRIFTCVENIIDSIMEMHID